jgi:hypothetical protein
MAALKRYNLAHLAERFRENNVDAVAFRGITEAMLEAMGRGIHSSPFPLNLSLPCPFALNLSLLCPPHNPT